MKGFHPDHVTYPNCKGWAKEEKHVNLKIELNTNGQGMPSVLYSNKTIMKNSLQESKNLFSWVHSLKSASWGALLLIVILLPYFCYKMGYVRGSAISFTSNEDISLLKENMEQLQSENLRYKEELSIAEQNYQIQLEAKKNLAEYLKSLQLHNSELSQNMALYQTVTSKTPIDLKAQIKAFYLFPTTSPDTFRYSVMLSKSTGTEYTQGVVTMVIKGMIGVKPISLSVKYVDSNRNDGLAFKFRHFQELTGELTLPESFIPAEVVVKVSSDKAGTPVIEQYPWVVAG